MALISLKQTEEKEITGSSHCRGQFQNSNRENKAFVRTITSKIDWPLQKTK